MPITTTVTTPAPLLNMSRISNSLSGTSSWPKLQGRAQQYHGEGSRDGERPALAGQKCQQGQLRVAKVQHLAANGQSSDRAYHGELAGSKESVVCSSR